MTKLSRTARRTAIAVSAVVLASLSLAACGKGSSAATLDLSAALPDQVPGDAVLRLGDPESQALIQAAGLDKELSDAGVKIEWNNLSGGPQTIQAFRGNKLDCGAVADIPSLFAAWTGTSTKIVFQAVTVNPLQFPTYRLGVAPGQNIHTLADLRGKKIAYSSGQAQGALVLRVLQQAGLTQKDVTLVDLTSNGDSYLTALGSKAVDVAPIGVYLTQSYIDKYRGASAIPTGIRDDASTLYCLTKSVQDAGKAAALKAYIKVRTEAALWENAHPDVYAQAYLEKVQGLSAANAQAYLKVKGKVGIPATWDGAISRLQRTADLLASEQDHQKLDVNTLVDRRFEKVESAAAGSDVVSGDAA